MFAFLTVFIANENINMLKLNKFHRGCFILILVFVQCQLIECSLKQGNIVKRMVMDIATCLGKFDVKSDMIIKTEESKKLGAKFLESADALSKVECLHLCCETENCDVFVYEEKGQGECFMFQCGPAENFRCKFSKHANYTSAIFSIEKKVQPPQIALKKVNVPTVALSQNEIELKNLKGKPSSDTMSVKLSLKNDATAAAGVVPVPPAKPIESTTIKVSAKNSTSFCSRFQFQCHSGDCIAVYNACDGIPQCDDGSDEGPECQSITRTPEAISNKASADGRVQLVSSKVQTNENAIIGHNREDPLTAPQWPNLISSDLNAVHQYTDDKAAYNRNGGLQITDNIQRLQPDFPVASKDAFVWNGLTDQNVISNWAQQQMPQFPMKTALQFPQKTTYTQYQPESDQKAMGASDPAQLKKQQYNINWPISESNLPNLPNSPNLLNHPNHNNEEVLPEKDSINVMKDTPVLDRKKDGKNISVQSKSDSKSTEDSDYNNEEEEETTTEPPKKKKKHRKVNKIGKQPPEERVVAKDSSEQQMKMIHSGLQTEFMDHYGAADRPGGAVVSLALGILITIGLVMVISCRTTAVRKRIRRGKGYAHDADFLVNGMYL